MLSMIRTQRHRLGVGAALTLCFVLALTGWGMMRSRVLAAPQIISLSPTSVDVTVQPGEVKHGSLQVINQGQTDYDFSVYATPYSVKGQDYTPDFTKLPDAPDSTSWFSFSTTHAHLVANQSLTVGYTITVPPATPHGDYYAAVFAQTSNTSSTGSAVVLNERVGELFYLRVLGQEVQKGTIVEWGGGLLQEKPLTVSMKLQNQGTTHYNANVQVVVSDMLGHQKYLLNTSKEILPQTVRKVTVPWKNSPSFGLFKVTASVSYLGKAHHLSTQYVFLLSNRVRFVFGPLLGTLLALLIIALARVGIDRLRGGGTRRLKQTTGKR